MYALSIRSRRGRGHVVACDLLRRVLRAKNRLALRRRVAADFSDYLITNHADVEIEAGVDDLVSENADLFARSALLARGGL